MPDTEVTTAFPRELIARVTPAVKDDLAIGLQEPEDVLRLHGFSEAEAIQLKNFEPLKRAVELRRTELFKEGLTHRIKAVTMADEALEELYLRIGPDTPTPQLLAIYQELKKSGRMDVVEQTQQNNLPSFQIVIEVPGMETVSLSSNSSNAVNQVIEGVSEEVPELPLPTLSEPTSEAIAALLSAND